MELKIDGQDFKNGEPVDFYFLFGSNYLATERFDIKTKPWYFPKKTEGTLQYNQAKKSYFGSTPAGWVLKDVSGKQYDYNKINNLNENPYNKDKYNLVIVKKGQGPQPKPQAPAQPKAQAPTKRTFETSDDDYFDDQVVEYIIVKNSIRYPELSGQDVDLRDKKDMFLTRNKGKLMYNSIGLGLTVGWWIVEGGKMTHDLTKFNVLNNQHFSIKTPNIQFLPSGNMTERMKQLKAAKERKAAEEAQEDQAAETNVTPIPCSQTAINLTDRVIYNKKEGIVTGFEIEYDDKTTQTVRCDENLLSITAGIEKNKSELYTKRNPGVVYATVVRAGKRSRRRKTRYGKKR